MTKYIIEVTEVVPNPNKTIQALLQQPRTYYKRRLYVEVDKDPVAKITAIISPVKEISNAPEAE